MAGQSGYCRSECQRETEEYENIIYDEPVPWKLEFRSSKAFVTWVVAIAVFTVRSRLLDMNIDELLTIALNRTFSFMAWYVLSRSLAEDAVANGAYRSFLFSRQCS